MRFAILLLVLAIALPVRADAPRLPAEKAQQICERVLALANSGALERSVLPFDRPSDAEVANREEERKTRGEAHFEYPEAKLFADVDGNGKSNLLYRLQGLGTCRNFKIVDAGAITQRRVSYSPYDPEYIGVGGLMAIDKDDDLRWAGWGNTEYLLNVMGEPLVLSGRVGLSSMNLRLVSWFRERRKRPLCSFEPTHDIVQTVAVSEDDQLCRAALRPERIAAKMEPGSEAVAAMLRTQFGGGVYQVSFTSVDLNRDGVVDRIARGVLSSGAGCGRDGITTFSDLSSDLSSVLDTPLHNVLRHSSWGPLPYGATTEDIVAKIIQFRGKPYILGEAPGGVGVYSVWGNMKKQWCEIPQRPLFRIKKLYPPRFE